MSKSYTTNELVLAVKDVVMRYKATYKEPPIMSEVRTMLIEVHSISRTVTQLNDAFVEIPELFDIARNNGVAVVKAKKPKWYYLLSVTEQNGITKADRNRPELPLGDILSKITVNQNGVIISNPIALMPTRTAEAVMKNIMHTAKLARTSTMSPAKADWHLMEAARVNIENAHITNSETTDLRLKLKEHQKNMALPAPAKKKAKG